MGLEKVQPSLILNVDETGFGASKSGRIKPQKVIIPKSYVGTPRFLEGEEKRFVSCIAATTASGRLLAPGLIATRKNDAEDAQKCSFYHHCRRYFSEKAFVPTAIFGDYIKSIAVPYVNSVREMTKEPDSSAVLLCDGHKGQYSPLLAALCAENRISLYVIPPHTSHILQPLDQDIFRWMKKEYSQFEQPTGLSKISSTLERVWSSYQATNVIHTVVSSWTRTGIVPQIEEGVAVRVMVDPAFIEDRVTMAEGETRDAASRGRPASHGEFGCLNEDQMLILEAGQCAFCCQRLA